MSENAGTDEQRADFQQLEHLADDLEQGGPGAAAVDENQGNPEEIPTEQVLMMVVGPLFDVICPNWNVTQQEKQLLCGSYAAVIDKYFGGVSMGVELQAIAVTAMILAPRIGKPRVAPSNHDGEKQPENSIDPLAR